MPSYLIKGDIIISGLVFFDKESEMKGGRNLREMKQEKEEAEGWVILSPCLNCGKAITDGYYGAFGEGGVCSKTCCTAQSAKPKYPNNPAEAFERLHNL